ncbi:hypothetical protein CCMSSC00406_0007179 [Pleurotus cornucopiae]|uniref:Uncharacterized protein n=1 Tax=Pleurotus cornucopiae TaxID=5321 RepID=A0ACB7IR70_PLECO|nr:hypothetical protein CCMSSC00406_0007179 [Pleurotus cornucopiae]
MGGLVVKKVLRYVLNPSIMADILQALLLARELEADGQYKAILNSVRGVVFIGTPHRGGNGVDGAKFIANFVRAFNVDVRYDLISSLRPASTDLFDLSNSFGRLLADRNHIKIATLYETKKTRIGWPVVGKRVWIVDEQSAILGVAGERRLSINTNHTDLIKFSHAADTSLSSTVQIVEEFCSNQSFGMASSTTTLNGPIPAAQGLYNPANVSLVSSEDPVVHMGSPGPEGSLIQDTPLRRQSTRTLMPPSGTSFWSVEHIPLFSGSRIYDEDKAYWMTLDWACECYVFTTNQTPDSHNFSNGGGAFYILFKHRGQINSTLYPHYQNFKLQIETTSSDTTPITHMPSYSTKNSSNEWTTTINYKQPMQMFRNNGQQMFTHVASYNDTYQLEKMNQYGGVVDGKVEVCLDADPGSRVGVEVYLA